MKKTAFALIIIILASSLSGCFLQNSGQGLTQTSFAMGSPVIQTIYGGSKQVLDDAANAIAELDNAISYRNPNSPVAQLNSERSLTLSGKVLEMLKQSVLLSDETEGKYDITVLKLIKLWGFDTDTPSLPFDEDIKNTLLNTGYENIKIENDKVTLTGNIEIDLSAAGKGEASEVAIDIYKKAGITGGVVAVGGSVGVFGTKNGENFLIGIRNPFDTSSLIATLEITDAFISTSGSYEKKFTKDGTTYHHLLDPDTGYPVFNNLISVTVVCGDGGLSDMLASAFFCIGIEKALSLAKAYNAEVIFITTDKQVFITKGLEKIYKSSFDYTALDS